MTEKGFVGRSDSDTEIKLLTISAHNIIKYVEENT